MYDQRLASFFFPHTSTHSLFLSISLHSPSLPLSFTKHIRSFQAEFNWKRIQWPLSLGVVFSYRMNVAEVGFHDRPTRGMMYWGLHTRPPSPKIGISNCGLLILIHSYFFPSRFIRCILHPQKQLTTHPRAVLCIYYY